MRKVRVSASAASYIRAEAAYLKIRSPSAAQRFLRTMREARSQLGAFPRSGRPADGDATDVMRKLVAGDYILLYEFAADDAVDLLSVRHGRQARPDAAGLDESRISSAESKGS